MKKLLAAALICAAPSAAVQAAATPMQQAAAFTGALAAGDFARASAMADPAVQGALSAATLEQLWKGLEGKYGKSDGCGAQELTAADVRTFCVFGGRTIALVTPFKPGSGGILGLYFYEAAGPYADQSLFTEEEVTVGSGEWALPGTLTLPKGEGPFPAAVLVNGSGPGNRNETMGPNRMFRDLAQGLAARGVAVLRYDKRTLVHADKMASVMRTFTVREEIVDDAVLAVKLLRSRKEADPRRVFVIGHSQGGSMLPRIAAACGADCAGFISLAGGVEGLGDAMLRQMTYIYSLDGKITEKEQKDLDRIKAEAEAIKDPALKPDGPILMGAGPAYWLDLRGYYPPDAAKSVGKPMLLLQGERDYNVTMQDFAEWKKALAGSPLASFTSYPKLNHYFMEGEGPMATPAENGVPARVAPYVADDVASWIKLKAGAGD